MFKTRSLPTISALIISLIAVIALVACGSDANNDIAADSPSTTASDESASSENDNLKAVYDISVSFPEYDDSGQPTSDSLSLLSGKVTIAQRLPSDLYLQFTGSTNVEGLEAEEFSIELISAADSDGDALAYLCIPFQAFDDEATGSCIQLDDNVLADDDPLTAEADAPDQLNDLIGIGESLFLYSVQAGIEEDPDLNMSQTGTETIAGLNATCYTSNLEEDLGVDDDLLGDINLGGIGNDLPLQLNPAELFGLGALNLNFCFSDDGLLSRINMSIDEGQITLELVSTGKATDDDFKCCQYPISDGSDLFGTIDLFGEIDGDINYDDFGEIDGDINYDDMIEDMIEACIREGIGDKRFDEIGDLIESGKIDPEDLPTEELKVAEDCEAMDDNLKPEGY